MASRCASRKSKLISPVPGSWRSGTSAICTWPMRPTRRSSVRARSPSMICMWKTSYCRRAFAWPAAFSTSIACLRRVDVRELVFDVAKAGGARQRKALEEVALREERRQVGGQLRHNGQNNLNLIDVAAAPWWAWPIALFAVSFLIGIVAVLAGVGGGVLFVPIVGTLFPFHLDFVRGAGLMFALSGTLAAGPQLLRSGMASLRLVMPPPLVGSIASFIGALVGLSLHTALLQTQLGILIAGIAVLLCR